MSILDEARTEILRRLREGESWDAVASRLGVSRAAIREIAGFLVRTGRPPERVNTLAAAFVKNPRLTALEACILLYGGKHGCAVRGRVTGGCYSRHLLAAMRALYDQLAIEGIVPRPAGAADPATAPESRP